MLNSDNRIECLSDTTHNKLAPTPPRLVSLRLHSNPVIINQIITFTKINTSVCTWWIENDHDVNKKCQLVEKLPVRITMYDDSSARDTGVQYSIG